MGGRATVLGGTSGRWSGLQQSGALKFRAQTSSSTSVEDFVSEEVVPLSAVAPTRAHEAAVTMNVSEAPARRTVKWLAE